MKSSFVRKLVTAMVCVGFCVAAASVQAEPKKEGAKKEAPKKEEAAKEQATVTGAAKAVANKTDATKKHLELTDKEGTTYMLLSKKITPEDVTKYDGKNVTVKGSKKAAEGTRKATIYVSEIEEAK